jgi:hypothetical protein
MKKKGVFNQFRKKALVSITALSVSGLLPAGVALAQGELNAEIVASQGTTLSGKPGETILVPINIFVTHFGQDQDPTSAVTVTANFEGQPAKQVSFDSDEFKVKKQVMLEYTIPNTTATTVTPRVLMASTDSTGKDKVVDEDMDSVTINVVQDTTAPFITLTNPISGYYNANTLPSKFTFNLDEDGEVFVNSQSQGTFTSGSHELNLPVSVQGINNVTIKAIDAAGNVSTTVSFTYFYDSINPLVTASAETLANINSWYNQDVKVSFSATDVNGSGVATVDPARIVSSEGQNQIITGYATDNSGNIGSGSIALNIDKTAPTINGSADRGANSFGWYNNDVTVSFNANDTLSGVASYTQPVTFKTEGLNQSVTGTATDIADNSKSTIVSGINIDRTAPVIEGFEDGAKIMLNKVVNWKATDNLSGIAIGEGGTLDTSKIGTYRITTTDKAGNTVEKTYSVVYNFGGILINGNGSNKAGSTIPVKFQLTDANGSFISTATARITYAKYDNNILGHEMDAVSTSNAVSGNLFRYDSTSNEYIFNFSSKGLTVGTYLITVYLNDGTNQKVKISLK